MNTTSKERWDAPSWVLDAVFYQIFPDRFANGDPENDPRTQFLGTPNPLLTIFLVEI